MRRVLIQALLTIPSEKDAVGAAPCERSVARFNLEASLDSGQAFCWKQESDGTWKGWIGSHPARIRQQGKRLWYQGTGLTEQEWARYFQWDEDHTGIVASFPDDPWMRRALKFASGMRILRQDPWETLINFICSAQKQVAQIAQINANLRASFGTSCGTEIGWRFPSTKQLAEAGEADLRACKLGFRAKHVFHAARQVQDGLVDLKELEKLSTTEARTELCKLRGVGEKVANCVLLFAYGRTEAFPIDVWIERILRELYFKARKRATPKDMASFAARYFGPHGGYAQQYLFHWARKQPHALNPAK